MLFSAEGISGAVVLDVFTNFSYFYIYRYPDALVLFASVDVDEGGTIDRVEFENLYCDMWSKGMV